MTIKQIPKEEIRKVWEEILPRLEYCLEFHPYSKPCSGDIYKALMDEDGVSLFCLFKENKIRTFFIISINSVFGCKIGNIWFAGNVHGGNISDIGEIEFILKRLGCEFVEVMTTRKSLANALNKLNYIDTLFGVSKKLN